MIQRIPKNAKNAPFEGEIISLGANLREKPSKKSNVLAILYKGHKVKVQSAGAWTLVMTTIDGKVRAGYVSHELIGALTPENQEEFTVADAWKEVSVSDFDKQLLDPKYAAEVAQTIDVIDKTIGALDTALGVYETYNSDAFDAAMKHLKGSDEVLKELGPLAAMKASRQLLGALKNILTITDADAREKWKERYIRLGGSGKMGQLANVSGVLKIGVETLSQSVAVSTLFAYGVARLTRNKAIMKDAAKYLGKVMNGIGKVAPIIDALSFANGVFILFSSGATGKEKADAMTDVATSAIGLAGAAKLITGTAAIAATLAIHITRAKFDLVAKHIYSPAIIYSTANGLSNTYAKMRKDGNAMAKHLLNTEQLLNLAIDSAGSDKENKYLTAAQQSLTKLYPAYSAVTASDSVIWNYPAIAKRFKNDRILKETAPFVDSLMKDSSYNIVGFPVRIFTDYLVSASRRLLEIMAELHTEFESVLEETVKEKMK